MELADFLLARIAEDERFAQAAAAGESGKWDTTVEETGDGENAYYAVLDEDHYADDYGYFADLGDKPADGARAAHIARHDPARVLAECEAKRRIVEGAQRVMLPDPRDYWQGAHDTMDGVLRLLAQRHADHPDYREEWRPAEVHQ